ncbi:MAG: two-component system, NarL family, sensor kinase [Pseudonocardiales bacterium]|jgi:two-component system NarL family sensor kinase|nr:two-component system, NarL family, sensor kinase [Pseudonocardiales bacterium]
MTAAAALRRAGMRGAPDVRRRLLAFVGMAVVVLLVIGLGTIVIAREVAQQEALRDAERTTTRLASLVVEPLLVDALSGNAARRDELDRAVRVRLTDGTMDELVVWERDGTIVYSDRTENIGRRIDLPELALESIDRGRIASDIDFGDETGDLPTDTRYVEVYTPLVLPGQQPLAFEAYYNADRVDERAASLATQLILLALVPLVLLQLVQIPIAVSLARRVARHQSERASLLERALSASDRERRAIASDLHDGVVQDLAGVGYALGALVPAVPPDRRGIADTCSRSVRGAVDTLRMLMVDIYPPDLTGAGLAAAVDGLAAPLRAAGTAVTVTTTPLPPMDPEAAAAVYRVARETLTNVAKHARAETVRIELGPLGEGPETACGAVRLRITDDGVGLPVDAMDRRDGGHLGLHMLIDRLADLGGRFTVDAGPDGGTTAEAVVPTRPGVGA